MKRYLFSMFCMCLIALQANAQTSYFTCDFEDATQNAQWSLTNGTFAAAIANKWCIGSATSNGGKSAMYISTDGGQTVSYVDEKAYVISYIDIHLEKGTYDLSFDWRAMGNTEAKDGLYVLWVPETDATYGDPILLNSNQSNIIATALQSHVLEVAPVGEEKLIGSATWKTCITTITSDGTSRRLAFLWLTDGNNTVANPGACIDNIIILDTKSCPAPTALNVTTDGMRINLDWVGNASAYEVKCFSYMDNSWTTQIVYDTTATTLTGITEGLCDFYVSSMCDEGKKSVPVVYSEHFLYYPSNHCIDYLTLDNSNCYISNEKVSQNMPVDRLTWSNKLVNQGYSAKESRHTMHYSWNETDPRTGGGLRTVPNGELASVRLGNWNTGAEAERAEFKFHVDAKKNPVLMLKYAVVLQKPGDGCTPNPGFLLRVLDEWGRLVSDCASADFDFKKAAAAEWNVVDEGTSKEVRWKDWTTVGVNLADFDGQTLTIQLTTYDCGGSGHYGYAYFTLGCSDGKLTGMSCGVENTEFIAPDGFVYQWYLQSNPDSILGHEQKFEVLPTDTNHYVVDMMFAQDSSCYFSLIASAQPYQPYAEAKLEYKSVDCKNIVQFTNLSHIIETNQVTDSVVHTSKPVDWILWDFGDGKTSYDENPEHVFSSEGGPINVKLIAHLSTCVDTLYITDTLPAIADTRDTLHVALCGDCDYTFSYTSRDNSVIDTTLTTTGIYEFVMPSISTGCDSVVVVNLFLYDSLMVDAVQEYNVCHGEPSFDFEYETVQGKISTYSLNFADNTPFATVENETLSDESMIEILIPTDAKPNIYSGKITFTDTIGYAVTIPFQLNLLYNANIVAQRWNDVLAVKNTYYGDSITFDKYQWYKISEANFTWQPLSGQTSSYLYLPEGLDPKSAYSVGLTRKGETVEIPTCAIYPNEEDSNQPHTPTLVNPSQPMPIKSRGKVAMNGVARWTTFNGATLAVQPIVDGQGVIAPSVSGLYLLTLIDKQGGQIVETILVQ